MSLGEVRSVFGIHSVTPYSRTTGLAYGTMKVLGGSNLTIQGDVIPLEGGSLAYPWQVKEGRSSAELSIRARQYEEFMFEVFLGKAPTSTSTDSGSVTTLTNKSGTSIADSDTGLASVGVKSGSETDLKYGKYIVKFNSATKIDVYGLSDADFGRGTDLEFVDDDLKVTSSALTITTGSAIEVPSLGVELTGGSGVIAFSDNTPADTATFEIKPPSSKSHVVKVGSSTDRTPEFGCYLVSEPLGNGEMFSIECYRVKSAFGLPLVMDEKAWSEAEINCQVFYDSTENALCQIRSLTPTTVS